MLRCHSRQKINVFERKNVYVYYKHKYFLIGENGAVRVVCIIIIIIIFDIYIAPFNKT
jgi:hypothetical protein